VLIFLFPLYLFHPLQFSTEPAARQDVAQRAALPRGLNQKVESPVAFLTPRHRAKIFTEQIKTEATVTNPLYREEGKRKLQTLFFPWKVSCYLSACSGSRPTSVTPAANLDSFLMVDEQ
jgi:hypothetical protein